MTRKKALERWETKISNTEATSQAIWPIAKSLLKSDGPRAPTAIHGGSHHMICITKTMNGGWRLKFKLY
jgi:hypothetical protein